MDGLRGLRFWTGHLEVCLRDEDGVLSFARCWERKRKGGKLELELAA